jgi:hypothetical protein
MWHCWQVMSICAAGHCDIEHAPHPTRSQGARPLGDKMHKRHYFLAARKNSSTYGSPVRVPPALAARELAARELAARELAARELAARELAARELAARDTDRNAHEASIRQPAELLPVNQRRLYLYQPADECRHVQSDDPHCCVSNVHRYDGRRCRCPLQVPPEAPRACWPPISPSSSRLSSN